jgi:chromosome partitioning protein
LPGQQSAASLAVEGNQDQAWLTTAAKPATWPKDPDSEKPELRQIPNLMGISAFHDLADTEDRVRLLWAIAEEERDIRYFLFPLLHSDAFRDVFSMVVIDAPPRLTTACVQALAASSHLLIPTVLDELSADAVGYFGKQLRRHEKLWPHLKVLGVIGTIAEGQKHEKPALRSAGDQLRSALRESRGKLYAVEASGIPFEFPYELAVPKLAALARNAGRGIAYASLGGNADGRQVRDIFDRLAGEVIRRMAI